MLRLADDDDPRIFYLIKLLLIRFRENIMLYVCGLCTGTVIDQK